MESTGSVDELDWQQIIPDENNDWINQRDKNYQKYFPLIGQECSVFINSGVGIQSNRDVWVTGFSKDAVANNTKKLIDNYNKEVYNLSNDIEYKFNNDSSYIKWTSELKGKAHKGIKIDFIPEQICLYMYRPFVKKWLFYDKNLVHRPGKYKQTWGKTNQALVTIGRGSNKDFSAYVTDELPDVQLLMNCQVMLRYDDSNSETDLFAYHDNVNQAFADKLGLSLDDTFAYIYGLLNSYEFQQKYANDLKKDLARIPIVANKEKYVEVGKKLMDLHINYEEVPVYEGVTIDASENPSYKVEKMKFAKKRNPETQKLENDRSIIIFNSDITIKNIPEKAYEYVVNGRSAIEWIIDQYQVKTDKKSGITDDPNDFSSDPKYIFNLLLRIINVSVQTVDLVNSLPKLEIIE